MMLRCLFLLGCAALFSGCIHIKLDPVEVHATVDVNVKVDEAVTNLLTDIYGDSSTVQTPAPTSR